MADLRCECCGSRVRIVSSGEGTCSYVPALPELPALLVRGVAAWRRKASPATAWYSGSIDERVEAIVWLGCSWEAGGDAFCGACIGLARVLPEEGANDR